MASDAIAAVVEQWKKNEALVKQAAAGVMAVVGKNQEITRKEVCANYKVLLPLVEHLGLLVMIGWGTLL